MTMIYYPAVLYPKDGSGYWAVTIAGININAQGASANKALENAAKSLQETVDMLRNEGAEIPQPSQAEEIDIFEGGSIVLVPLTCHAG